MLLIEYRRMMGNDMPCVEAEVEATSGGEAGVAEAVVADGDGEVVEVEVGEELAEGIARELKRETILATWWDSVTGMNTQILLHHNFHHHLFLSGALLHAISILLSKKLLSSIVYLGKYQFSRVSSARSIMMRTVPWYIQKNLIPSSDDVSPLNTVHLPWFSSIDNALRNSSSSAPSNDMPFTSSPLWSSYTVQMELMYPLASAQAYISDASCSGFLQSMRHRVLDCGSSHSPLPCFTKSSITVLMASALSCRPILEFFHRGQSCTRITLIFRSVWYFNISSLHCAICFSRVARTGCIVKNGGKE
mmetsp:Transcript_26190/g.57480  ORF Transcript_26190/g.57480 Transcript_26190/m.57480 type:complete len:305 (+) Transcript_26190:305-1219(+)